MIQEKSIARERKSGRAGGLNARTSLKNRSSYSPNIIWDNQLIGTNTTVKHLIWNILQTTGNIKIGKPRTAIKDRKTNLGYAIWKLNTHKTHTVFKGTAI